MSREIVVIGSINMDLVAHATTLPQPGETVFGKSFRTFHGGKGANQAVAAARLGASVALIGKVGSDAFGVELRESLASSGVDVTGVSVAECSSGVALITTDAEARNSIVVVGGANDLLLPEDVERHRNRIRAASVVLLQLETPMKTLEHVARLLSGSEVVLIVDPAPAQALGPALTEAATWLTPNESESATLLQDKAISPGDLREVATGLLDMGCENVVLKLGARGVYLRGRQQPNGVLVPAYKVDAVDTTAAGDAFNGAFAVGLSEGWDAERSARYACAAASCSVSRHGAQVAVPTREELTAFLHSVT